MIPHRQYLSEAENRAGAAAVRRRLFSPQRAPVKREDAKPVLTLVVEPEVNEASFTPAQFLKHLCRQAGLGYLDVTSPSRTADLVKDRDRMVIAVVTRFPHLSIADLARMFNRDRATIHKCLARCGMFLGARKGLADHEEEIKDLLMDGLNYSQIGDLLGFTGNSISVFVRTHKLTHLAAKKRKIADHAELVKAMYMEGKAQTEIAAVINFDASGVCKFVKSMGWTR